MENKKNVYPEALIDHRCILGEGVLWDEKRDIVVWVDIEQGKIHEYSSSTEKHDVIEVNQKIGTIAICDNGDYIAAMQNGIGFINRDNYEIKMIADPESDIPGNRFNDGKCDPAGRFWAGTMSELEEPHAGHLYVLNKDLSIERKIEGVTVSNGMAWDVKRRLFYYIDSPTQSVVAFDYDIRSGQIKNKRVVIKIPEKEGSPDGMTMDSEGMLWVALWDGWKVGRWDPFTGKKLYEIKLPASKVTSCTFGGKHLDSLYITTAKIGLSKEDLVKQPLAGSLFVLPHCGFKGMPGFEFNNKCRY